MSGWLSMKVLIAGGGEFAENLIKFLGTRDHEIVVIERDEARVKELESHYDVVVLRGDATDADIYSREISMEDITAALALTNRDEVNLLVLAVAKASNVPIRIGRFSHEKVAEMAQKLGLGIPVTQPRFLASFVAYYLEAIARPRLLGRVGDFNLYVVGIAEGDRAAGSTIRDLELTSPEKGAAILIINGSGIRFPSEDEVLKPGDLLFVLAPDEGFVERIKG